jgi:hypothetical protein
MTPKPAADTTAADLSSQPDSLVESNQATKSAEPLEEKRAPGYLPVEVEAQHGSGCHNHIDGAIARYLVGNQHIVTAGVPCLGQQLIVGHGVGVVSSARTQSPAIIAGLRRVATSLWLLFVASPQRVPVSGYRRRGGTVVNVIYRLPPSRRMLQPR